jgi:hypothetical protein
MSRVVYDSKGFCNNVTPMVHVLSLVPKTVVLRGGGLFKDVVTWEVIRSLGALPLEKLRLFSWNPD